MVIDFHTHPFMIQELNEEYPALEKSIRDVYGLLFPPQPLVVFLKEMDEAGVDSCVLHPIDCTFAHGCKIVTNEAVAALCAKNSRFFGFASVDPHSASAVKDIVSAVEGLGLKGLKLDPALQQFDVNSAEHAYPLYQKCGELGIPILMHSGLNWAPKAMTKDGFPLDLEPAIISFPETKFVIAHLGWPWVNEASTLAMKYSNVYLDTSVVYSGTPAECMHHVIFNTMGKEIFERNLFDKVLYGSNYPRTDMRRSMRGIEQLEFSDYLTDHLFHLNARHLLGF
jgi:hypothetical protein